MASCSPTICRSLLPAGFSSRCSIPKRMVTSSSWLRGGARGGRKPEAGAGLAERAVTPTPQQGERARVAHPLLHRVVGDEPVSAEQLHGVLGDEQRLVGGLAERRRRGREGVA